MRVRITLLLLIVAALAIPFFMARAQSSSNTEQSETQTENVEVYVVERGTVRDFVEVSGSLDAEAVASVSFPISGQIETIYVRSGDYVMEGAILAALDNDLERIAYSQAVLAVNEAEVGYYDLITINPDNIAIAEANLQAAWNSYTYVRNQLTPEDIAAMNEQYRRLREDADYLELEASQAPGGVGSSAWNLLTAEGGESSFNAEIARLNMELAQIQNDASAWPAYASVLQAQAELDRILAGPTDAQVRRAELSLEDTQTQLEFAREDYEDTFLRAPFDGVISGVDVDAGTTVIANSPIMEMTDITPLTLTVQIDEIDLRDVEEGAQVEVTFDALPDITVNGTLLSISPGSTLVNNIVTYEADIELTTIPADARVGMVANVQIITEELPDVILVPNQFITEEGGRTTISILTDNGELVEVDVELGFRGVQTSEVVRGLSGGERLGIINEPVSNIPEDNPFEG